MSVVAAGVVLLLVIGVVVCLVGDGRNDGHREETRWR